MAEHAEKQHKPLTPAPQPAPQQEDVIPQLGLDFAAVRQLAAASPPLLKPNTILKLQSLIGNQAVQRLLASTGSLQRQHHPIPERIGPPPPPPPTGPYGYAGPVHVVDPLAGQHTPPEEADAAIRAALGQHLTQAIAEGRQITDHVNIVDDEMWDRAGEARYGREEWFDRGHRDAVSAWTEVDNNRVFIRRDREDVGTMIHEALHLYASHISTGSHALSEGITEYFTQQIMRSLTPPLTGPNHYPEESGIAEMLVNLVGRDVVARANFEGDVAGLQAAYRRVMFLSDPGDWDAFIQRMNREDWAAARQFVTPYAL